MEKITHVAIIHKGTIYTLPKPNRHHDVIHYICEKGEGPVGGTSNQGFFTSEGRFLDRKAAWNLAKDTNQILTKKSQDGITYERAIAAADGILFSEDLW